MKRLIALFLVMLPWFALAADVQPIAPIYQGTKTISCTTGGVTTTLPTGIAQQAAQLEIQNAGTSAVFVEVGASTIAAAVNSGYPILAGQSKVISVSPSITTIACISGTGTQTVYVTTGSGN